MSRDYDPMFDQPYDDEDDYYDLKWQKLQPEAEAFAKGFQQSFGYGDFDNLVAIVRDEVLRKGDKNAPEFCNETTVRDAWYLWQFAKST